MAFDFDFKLIGSKLQEAEDLEIKIQPMAAYFLAALILKLLARLKQAGTSR